MLTAGEGRRAMVRRLTEFFNTIGQEQSLVENSGLDYGDY